MRLSTQLTDSEVFSNFFKIAEEKKLLEKKAELLYPDYDISSANPELDIALSVTASEHDRLYDVHNEKGEDLVDAAHPGGGTETQLDVKPSDKLDLVETIVEQHKVIEEIARGTPSGKLASLSERLVSLAGSFDEAGFEVMADNITATIEELGELIVMKTVVAQEGAEHHFDPVLIEGDPKAMRKAIQQGNLQAQQLINRARNARGLAPIREDGVLGRETLGAMNELGVKPGSYKTWGQLYSMLGGAAKAPSGHMAGPAPGKAPIEMEVARPELGRPAPIGKKMTPAPGLSADDGMDARSRDAQMLEQPAKDKESEEEEEKDEEKEQNAEDPFSLRQKALQDAKRKLQEQELSKALQGVKPKAPAPNPLQMKTMPAPDAASTFQLGKVRTQRPADSGMGKHKPKPIPVVQPGARDLNLTQNQALQMQQPLSL